MKLKVWGTAVIRHRCPGCSPHGQVRAVVAARSRSAAAKAFQISDRELKNYGSPTGNEEEIRMAMSKPGTVFFRSMDYPKTPFIEDSPEFYSECF